jgi:iron complex transport system permease protein
MSTASTDLSRRHYQRMRGRRLFVLLAVAMLIGGSFIGDLTTGPAGLTAREIASTILHPSEVSRSQQVIIWSFRLPIAVMAVVVGAALGLAGGQMQTVLNNPLASPYTLGVSAAAAFGAALVIVFGTGRLGVATTVAIPVGAFLSAAACSLFLFVACRVRGGGTEMLIVGGVALHFLFSSGLALLEYLATRDAFQAIVFWTFGSLQGTTWRQVAILAVELFATLALIVPSVWQLTALQLGDDYASGLGVDVERLRLRTMLLVSLLTSTAVSFTGSIGFVGLIAPHLARLLVGEDQRYFIALSAGIGALLVSIASILCKTLVPGTVLPIGVLTAAVGAPFFVALAISRRSRWP